MVQVLGTASARAGGAVRASPTASLDAAAGDAIASAAIDSAAATTTTTTIAATASTTASTTASITASIAASAASTASSSTATSAISPACTSADGQTWPRRECCSRQLARRRRCRATVVGRTGTGMVTAGALGVAAARRGGDANRLRRRGALREAVRARAAAARRRVRRDGGGGNGSACVAPHAAPNATVFGCGSASGWRAALACLAAPLGGFCMAAHGCMASRWRVDDLSPRRRAALVTAPETAFPQSCFDVSQPRGLAAAARATPPGEPPPHVAPRCPAAAAATYAQGMLGGVGGANLLSPSFDGELDLELQPHAVEAATPCSRGCNPTW